VPPPRGPADAATARGGGAAPPAAAEGDR